MKKVKIEKRIEEAEYYSDFSGKFLNIFGPDINLKISFNYGSKYDGTCLELDLSDEDIKEVLDLLKSKTIKSSMYKYNFLVDK